MTNRAHQTYKPEFRFGLGGVSLGNEFNKHTNKDAEATLEAAWAEMNAAGVQRVKDFG